MNRLAFITVAFGWLASVLRVRGAQEPTVTRGPVKIGWFTCEPELGPNREFVKWEVQAEYFVVVIEPSGKRVVETIGVVPTDLLKGTKGVFFDKPELLPSGMAFYPDRLVARLLNEVLMRSYRETFPSAPEDDERFKAMRSQNP